MNIDDQFRFLGMLILAALVVGFTLFARQICLKRGGGHAGTSSQYFWQLLFFVMGYVLLVFCITPSNKINWATQWAGIFCAFFIPITLLWLIVRTPRHFDPAADLARQERAVLERLRIKAAQEKAQATLEKGNVTQEALSTPATPMDHNRSKEQAAPAR